MDKLLAILKSLGIEVTDALKEALKKAENIAMIEAAFKVPDGLLTQDQFNDAIGKRLKAVEKQHEIEVNGLKDEMKKLVDPAKVTEVENTFKGQLETANKRIQAMTKENKLREGLQKAGVKDMDYLMFQAEKKGIMGRFTVDDSGNILVIGADGKPAFGKDAKPLEFSSLVEEMKTEYKDYFTGGNSQTPERTNTWGTPGDPGSIGARFAKDQADQTQPTGTWPGWGGPEGQK